MWYSNGSSSSSVNQLVWLESCSPPRITPSKIYTKKKQQKVVKTNWLINTLQHYIRFFIVDLFAFQLVSLSLYTTCLKNLKVISLGWISPSSMICFYIQRHFVVTISIDLVYLKIFCFFILLFFLSIKIFKLISELYLVFSFKVVNKQKYLLFNTTLKLNTSLFWLKQ